MNPDIFIYLVFAVVLVLCALCFILLGKLNNMSERLGKLENSSGDTQSLSAKQDMLNNSVSNILSSILKALKVL